jgi:hypothetical protein
MMVGRADRMAKTVEDYSVWSARQRSFEQLGGVSIKTVTLGLDGLGAAPVQSAAITPSMHAVLATAPVMGRPLYRAGFAPRRTRRRARESCAVARATRGRSRRDRACDPREWSSGRGHRSDAGTVRVPMVS